ncbi:hypothetical protein ACJDU8_05355 [Clostridium sp. WILCCON 0269]|uniref:Tyr recombinase domain-containing protein n=1 Tax=Candidatus Clostridium eludens TaxID=3381663 RepID=A0ABW8SG37_9CLOT
MDNTAKNKTYTYADYMNYPENERIELIEGKMYAISPAPSRIHQELIMKLSARFYNYIKSNNGNCKVYTSPFDVFLTDDENKNPNIIKTINKLLKTGLNQAVKEHYIIFNPCDNVTLPKLPPKKEIQIFTVEEEIAFIKSLLNHRNRALFILVLGTGLRIDEVVALK